MSHGRSDYFFYFPDGDEPLQSGSGIVSKDVTDENLLDSWRDVMARWHQNLRQRPKQVQSLVRKGIPEALRGEVWQLLAGCTDNTEMLEAYRILIAKVRLFNSFFLLHTVLCITTLLATHYCNSLLSCCTFGVTSYFLPKVMHSGNSLLL